MYNYDEFEIKPATKRNFKAVISLAGDSGSGKTYSALRLARGLVGNSGKIGLIDTEQRAGMYADCFGGFTVIDLYDSEHPVDNPFSPERYGGALAKFQHEGYNCVIIDSMSHEWEGDGGIISIADSARYKNGAKRDDMGKWIEPKRRHKQLMDFILRCGMHIILCHRIKYPLEEFIDDKGKKNMKRGDPIIIRENSVIYDTTADILLSQDTKTPQKLIKCPEALEYLFPSDKYITEETGAKIIEWLNSKQRDKDAIIREGSVQKDRPAWFKTLNESERYLAKKYADQIKQFNNVEEL